MLKKYYKKKRLTRRDLIVNDMLGFGCFKLILYKSEAKHFTSVNWLSLNLSMPDKNVLIEFKSLNA